MPRAQEARLRDAAVEYLQAVQGDGRGHGTGLVAGVETIKAARALVETLGGDQGIRADRTELTPGQRAAGSARTSPPNFDPAQIQ